jgi:hypothetical protein
LGDFFTSSSGHPAQSIPNSIFGFFNLHLCISFFCSFIFCVVSFFLILVDQFSGLATTHLKLLKVYPKSTHGTCMYMLFGIATAAKRFHKIQNYCFLWPSLLFAFFNIICYNNEKPIKTSFVVLKWSKNFFLTVTANYSDRAFLLPYF